MRSACALVLLLLTRVAAEADGAAGARVSAAADAAADAAAGRVIVAYLPEYRFEISHLDSVLASATDVVLFSIEPAPFGGEGGLLLTGRLDAKVADIVAARDRVARQGAASPRGARLLACVGGAGRSAGFKALVASKKARAGFVARLAAWLDAAGLDGADFDWEAPASEAELRGCVAAAAAAAARPRSGMKHEAEPPFLSLSLSLRYVLLLAEARAALAPSGRLVSVALHPGQSLAAATPAKGKSRPAGGAWRGVDRVHLMT